MRWIYRAASRVGAAVMRRLDDPNERYQQRIVNNMANLYRVIRPGDVVLVEGRSRIARYIKVFSQSHWSHVAIHVGDAAGRGGPLAGSGRLPRDLSREDARHLLVEANSGEGVVVVPLRKYEHYNIRICRPMGIRDDDRQRVIARIIAAVGKRYDQRNIVDIALMQLHLKGGNGSRPTDRLGAGSEYEVFCSGMIAEAFQNVGYPIVPVLVPAGRGRLVLKDNPWGQRLHMRHFSQILPRDFDLSPNFDIIKFNIPDPSRFNYRCLPWVHTPRAADGTVPVSAPRGRRPEADGAPPEGPDILL